MFYKASSNFLKTRLFELFEQHLGIGKFYPVTLQTIPPNSGNYRQTYINGLIQNNL